MLIPKTVILVRHAESEGNRIIRETYERFADQDEALARLIEIVEAHPDSRNWNLTEHGKSQAARLRAYLFHRFGPNNFDMVFVSGLVRAQQTLAIALPGIIGLVDGRLDEIPRGIFQSPNELLTPKIRPREEILGPLARRDDFIDYLHSGACAEKDVIVFGHGAWIASLLAYPNPNLTIGLGSTSPGVANTSLTILRAYKAQSDVPQAPCWRLRLSEHNSLPIQPA